MTDGQTKQAKAEEKDRAGERNLVDNVGQTNIYPVSEMEGASGDAKVHDEKSFGRGERGAEGSEDSGGSGVIHLDSGKPEKEEI